jgi:quinol monooxygenase YgiN
VFPSETARPGWYEDCTQGRIMVRLKVSFAASPGYSPRILDALRFLIGETRLEDGCVTCAAWSDGDSTVQYLEEWASEATMRRRVQSDAFTSLLSVMEAASRAPHVQFEFNATVRGLDYIAEVRRQLAS